MQKDTAIKTATLHRMVMADHMCPYGLKSKDLLERQGFTVDDRHLTSREQVDAFKATYDVKTTPQTFVDGERIGGFGDLRKLFGKAQDDNDAVTYQPIIALFSVAMLMAIAVTWLVHGSIWGAQTPGWFIAIAMVLLGLQKLQNLDAFATMFLNYDLLARKWVPYAYIYPFVETGAGILMTGMILTWVSTPAALLVASVGAISVFKAVYIDKRELKCACVGGNSNVPLGFVSLTENLMMVGMAVVMLWLMI